MSKNSLLRKFLCYICGSHRFKVFKRVANLSLLKPGIFLCIISATIIMAMSLGISIFASPASEDPIIIKYFSIASYSPVGMQLLCLVLFGVFARAAISLGPHVDSELDAVCIYCHKTLSHATEAEIAAQEHKHYEELLTELATETYDKKGLPRNHEN